MTTSSYRPDMTLEEIQAKVDEAKQDLARAQDDLDLALDVVDGRLRKRNKVRASLRAWSSQLECSQRLLDSKGQEG